MQKILIIIIAIAIFASCKQEMKYKTHESGLEYKEIVKSKSDKKAKVGDYVSIRMKYFYKKTLLFNSLKTASYIDWQIKKPTHKGGSYEDALLMMNEGDSTHFLIDAISFYRFTSGYEIPEYIKKGDKLRFEIKLNKILDKDEIQAKEENNLNEKRKKEQELLDAYIVSEGIKHKPTKTGLYVLHQKLTNGRKVNLGDTVIVHYKAYFIDGKIFDSTIDKNKPFIFVVGEGKAIPALEEAVLNMRKGEKAKIIAKSELAYGKTGYLSIIKPFSTLIFELKLLDVR